MNLVQVVLDLFANKNKVRSNFIVVARTAFIHCISIVSITSLPKGRKCKAMRLCNLYVSEHSLYPTLNKLNKIKFQLSRTLDSLQNTLF